MEGYLRKTLGSRVQVFSCGLEPTGVDPQAIRAMAEDQVVIAGQTSDSIEDFRNFNFDHILTFEVELEALGRETFPNTPAFVLELPLIDGFGGSDRQEAVRNLRDQIRDQSLLFIQQHLS